MQDPSEKLPERPEESGARPNITHNFFQRSYLWKCGKCFWVWAESEDPVGQDMTCERCKTTATVEKGGVPNDALRTEDSPVGSGVE